MKVSYKFVFGDGSEHRIEVDLERAPPSGVAQPQWTQLAFRQCPNCPLKPEQQAHCPAAVDLAPTVQAFAHIISHHEAQVVVETPERVVGKACQVQTALQSVAALIMATSACPILGRMRGLAYTHLPFATLEESMFRVLGSYLLRQLLIHRNGGEPDWELEGLKAHYADLEILNRAFKARIDAAAEQDAAINAVSALGVLSMGIGFSIDDQLPELARLAVTA
ncbi:MAG TPA: hypothetical protein VHE37_17075 [Nevskiaceae bacterium]|nr:hypothetical protein [Nevskiaceae bacterium]